MNKSPRSCPPSARRGDHSALVLLDADALAREPHRSARDGGEQRLLPLAAQDADRLPAELRVWHREEQGPPWSPDLGRDHPYTARDDGVAKAEPRQRLYGVRLEDEAEPLAPGPRRALDHDYVRARPGHGCAAASPPMPAPTTITRTAFDPTPASRPS